MILYTYLKRSVTRVIGSSTIGRTACRPRVPNVGTLSRFEFCYQRGYYANFESKYS